MTPSGWFCLGTTKTRQETELFVSIHIPIPPLILSSPPSHLLTPSYLSLFLYLYSLSFSLSLFFSLVSLTLPSRLFSNHWSPLYFCCFCCLDEAFSSVSLPPSYSIDCMIPCCFRSNILPLLQVPIRMIKGERRQIEEEIANRILSDISEENSIAGSIGSVEEFEDLRLWQVTFYLTHSLTFSTAMPTFSSQATIFFNRPIVILFLELLLFISVVLSFTQGISCLFSSF